MMLRAVALVAVGAALLGAEGGEPPRAPRGTPLPDVGLVPLVAPGAEPGAREAGAVEGVVSLESVPPETPPMLSPYARRRYRPPPASARSRITPENVIVYVPVDGVPGGPADPSPSTSDAPASAVITQRDRTIIPHVTAIRVGTRIDFPNEDDVFHNLFSLSDARPFNLGRYPPGESRSVLFERPGVIRMFCDIHSEMTAVIRVLDTPHYARPEPDGSFRIAGIPEGRRTVVAWHDQLGADTVMVEVSSALDARIDLQLPR